MTPKSPNITVRVVGATDVGLIREHNEDRLTLLDLDSGETDFRQPRAIDLGAHGLLMVVCDGMGGAAAGEVAAQMAVDTMRREMALHAPAGAIAASRATLPSGSQISSMTTPARLPRAARADGVDTVDPTASGAIETSPSSEDPVPTSTSLAQPSAEDPGPSPHQEAPGAAMQSVENRPQELVEGPPASVDSDDPPMTEERLHELARQIRVAGQRANREIGDAASADVTKQGMGTTMTCMLMLRSHVLVGQVGDSRAYLWRAGKLTQITHDQSLVNQLLESGQITQEQAKAFEYTNVILQALGVQEGVDVVLSAESVRRNDRILLCSDGLSGLVTDEEIQAVLGSEDPVDEMAKRLIEMARAAGGPDNITAIIAQVTGDGASLPGAGDEVAYRPMYIDGDRPPERRAWMPSYGQPMGSGGMDLMGPSAIQNTPPGARPWRTLTIALVLVVFALGLYIGLSRRVNPPNPLVQIKPQPGTGVPPKAIQPVVAAAGTPDLAVPADADAGRPTVPPITVPPSVDAGKADAGPSPPDLATTVTVVDPQNTGPTEVDAKTDPGNAAPVGVKQPKKKPKKPRPPIEVTTPTMQPGVTPPPDPGQAPTGKDVPPSGEPSAKPEPSQAPAPPPSPAPVIEKPVPAPPTPPPVSIPIPAPPAPPVLVTPTVSPTASQPGK